MFVKTSRRRLTGAAAAVVRGSECCLCGRAPWCSPLPTSPGSLLSEPHLSGERQSHRKEVNMHMRLLAKSFPLVQLGTPRPRLPPSGSLHPPTLCLPLQCPGLPPSPGTHRILHKSRAMGENCAQVTEQQAPRILWASGESRLLTGSEDSIFSVTLI